MATKKSEKKTTDNITAEKIETPPKNLTIKGDEEIYISKLGGEPLIIIKPVIVEMSDNKRHLKSMPVLVRFKGGRYILKKSNPNYALIKEKLDRNPRIGKLGDKEEKNKPKMHTVSLERKGEYADATIVIDNSQNIDIDKLVK